MHLVFFVVAFLVSAVMDVGEMFFGKTHLGLDLDRDVEYVQFWNSRAFAAYGRWTQVHVGLYNYIIYNV